ncbi:DUF2382 domain-containing protein [Paraburkholderia sp. BCC1886]|uniref:DUF2382 domain-containing protein n=1 Tax=Paraburkholderia sp. BCC1886 TaxID=2562670 RepID=UPI001182369F|nr:DUF2382 domain-containing protein [Paraburkholderia sp. BCC1886]
MNPEPSDPVERADQRRQAVGNGDVTEKADGTIEQRPHGNMDETLVPKGKDHPEQGPYVPEHDGVDPDKTAHVVEEVTVGKVASERTETINETLKGTKVEVERVEGSSPGVLASDAAGAPVIRP